jgi:hypothetical protein
MKSIVFFSIFTHIEYKKQVLGSLKNYHSIFFGHPDSIYMLVQVQAGEPHHLLQHHHNNPGRHPTPPLPPPPPPTPAPPPSPPPPPPTPTPQQPLHPHRHPPTQLQRGHAAPSSLGRRCAPPLCLLRSYGAGAAPWAGVRDTPSPSSSSSMVGGQPPPPRDPVYDGVGPRTSADGSSKLRYHHTYRYLRGGRA